MPCDNTISLAELREYAFPPHRCTCAPDFICQNCRLWDMEEKIKKGYRFPVPIMQARLEKLQYDLDTLELSKVQVKARKQRIKQIQIRINTMLVRNSQCHD